MTNLRPELIAKRYRAERRFKAYGIAAILVPAAFLAFLLTDLVIKAAPALFEHRLVLEVEVPAGQSATQLAKGAIQSALPQASARAERRALTKLLSAGAGDDLAARLNADAALAGQTLRASFLLSDDADQYLKGYVASLTRTPGSSTLSLTPEGDVWRLAASGLSEGNLVLAGGGAFRLQADGSAEVLLSPENPQAQQFDPGNWQTVAFNSAEGDRGMDDRQILMLEAMKDKGLIEKAFAWRFFVSGDSREAELAGIAGALFGSIMTVLLALVLCLPIGVGAAVYLEEFAPRNHLTSFIEVNINNLAAVPSIIFGLLGLAVFLGTFGLPRSTPLAGGLVLALLVLPTIIIAARAALRSVPPSIKEAALGVGASHQQAIFHHVLPLALPGILTGTILGVARALGETAPLLMIGMVAFIADIPGKFTDPAAVLPVQVFLWSDLPEAAFRAKTALAIITLLSVLFLLNALAIYLRRRFERRW